MRVAIIALLVATAAIASPISNDVDIAPTFNPRQDTRFLLFTRFNPTIPHIININDVSSLAGSNYSRDRPLRVLVHGWQSAANSDINILTTAAFMRSYDVNVIVVDWEIGADNVNYVSSRNQVPLVGSLIGELLDSMSIGGYLDNFSRTSCIGHSLGAHICGLAGKRLSQGRFNTIIGLDPAGPLFTLGNPATRLDSTDAEYVEVIHTDIRSFGIGDPIGHADFFPNGGSNQPGCLTQICDHNLVVNFYVESLNSDRLWGRQCANLQQVENNACTGVGASMGGEPSNHRLSLRGIYRFGTNPSSPFGQGPF